MTKRVRPSCVVQRHPVRQQEILRSQRPEVLSIHGQGRMHALDIPGNVRGAQRLAVSVEPGSQSTISDPDDPDGQRHGVYKRAAGDQIKAQDAF